MDYGGEEIEDTHPLICPLCEVHELDPCGRDSTLCPHCGLFGGVFLESLRQVSALPDVASRVSPRRKAQNGRLDR
jgi:hypothetical protein